MNQSQIIITAQGIRGGKFTPAKETGFIKVHIDTNFHDQNINCIMVDAFKGSSDDYARRDESEITIVIGGVTYFKGSIKALEIFLTGADQP